MSSRSFETRSRPRFLAATLATLPSMSLFPKAPFDLSVLPMITRTAPVLAPATLAALPSNPRDSRSHVFYVARAPAAPFTRCFPRSPAAAGSLIPSAPFADLLFLCDRASQIAGRFVSWQLPVALDR
jgi:hypothetical protein